MNKTAESHNIISINQLASEVKDVFRPHDVVSFNGAVLKLSRLRGECNWHRHDEEELFLCWQGVATVELRSGDIELEAGELFVVPRNAEHRSKAVDAVVLHCEIPRGRLYEES